VLKHSPGEGQTEKNRQKRIRDSQSTKKEKGKRKKEMKKVTDDLGTYEINMNSKFIDENDYSKIYFNVFDNGERQNASRYKVNLLFTDDEGKQRTFIAPLLNRFQPATWLEPIPEDYREYPFYRQALELRSALKYAGKKLDMKFSAGFFHEAIEDSFKINTAYAYGFIEEGQLPMFGFRFWDFTWLGPMEESGLVRKNAPKWSKSIKCKVKKTTFNGWE
jgi:hypothetical protein